VKYRISLALILLLGAACSEKQPEAVWTAQGARQVLELDHGWQFLRKELAPESNSSALDWKSVSLPHTWNAKDGQDGGDDYYRGNGSYQRNFAVPQELAGRRIYAHFDGAATTTRVFVNGAFAGEHRGNYAAFRFDITGLVDIGGDNDLLVIVNNEADDTIAPLSADFTFFGGLYRRVRLISTAAVHVDMLDYASPGVYWQQPAVSRESADLVLNSRISNDSDSSAALEIHANIRDDSGALVASKVQEITVPAQSSQAFSSEVLVEKPRLWQGIDDPYLYKAELQVFAKAEEGDNSLLDQVDQQLGLRSFSVDPDRGLILNDKPWPLFGINLMSDRPGKGTAISREDHEEDLQLIMELGATGLRLGHQQRDPFVYQRADELGLVVWAEVPLINRINDSPEFTANVRQQALELVRQNFNHPAILFWGLYNEITLKPGPDPRPLVEELSALVKAEDPGRLTTAAAVVELVDQEALQDPLVRATDLTSFNRYYGWYHGDFEDLRHFLDGTRAAAPELRFGLGEFGAGAGVSIHSSEPRMQDHSEEYQALFHEHYLEMLSQRPWLWGNFIWVLADFAVDSRDEGENPGRNDKGLVSFDRTVRKDAFYWYKANWSREPVLHLTGSRFRERTAAEVEIKAYSNLDQLELSVNGKVLGDQSLDGRRKVSWLKVPLQMGENRLVVTGVSARGEKLQDEMLLLRVESTDTSVRSELLGVDAAAGRIYNLPGGVKADMLEQYLQFAQGTSHQLLHSGEAGVVTEQSLLRVTAQDGKTRRDYHFGNAALSVAKPVSANKENRNAFKVGPVSVPAMSAAMANDGRLTEKDSGLMDVNVWNTMQPHGPAWWKVDLGAVYYLDSLESIWPTHMDTVKSGSMQYRVEIAGDFEQTFDQFSETYELAVDRSGNEEEGPTLDPLGREGRFVKITLLHSGIKSSVPVVGEFPIYGAEEFTVQGGLLYSDSLAIDYVERTVSPPLDIRTVSELASQLRVVSGGRLELLDTDGAPLGPDADLARLHTIKAIGSDERLYELYTVKEDGQ
jgi:beta-galactosidase